ncbi:TonB-dependent siderophore receptor [uncultured Aquitalea sp.]|uniref:TonB-dependent receptor n=1 Tax=uncultured Aquitalea sp. TaxID=540272 RepID=UPI0025DDCCA0|nr:TonB-dependent siderophore receptor [uncultured Aquitalea sp.]
MPDNHLLLRDSSEILIDNDLSFALLFENEYYSQIVQSIKIGNCLFMKPKSYSESAQILAPLVVARALGPSPLALHLALAGVLCIGFFGQAFADDAPILPTVTVSADSSGGQLLPYAGGQVARGARLGLLGNTDTMKSPFNISSYTAQKMQDLQVDAVAGVVTQDSSVRVSQNGGVVDSYFIRGFPINEGNLGEIAFDGLYGVAPNYRVFTDYAERVEVLKGPGALLYGLSPNSGVGGVINVVPKRAKAEDLTRVTTDFATSSQIGEHFDLSRRFGADLEFGFRLNGRHSQGSTAVDKQSRKTVVGSLALDYQGERLRASLDAYNQEEKYDAPSRPFLIASEVAVPSAPANSNNVSQPWAWSKIKEQGVLFKAEYDLIDKLTLFVNAGGSHSDVARLSDQTPKILNSVGDTSATPMYYKFGVDRSSADAGLRVYFDTGVVHHAVTVQASSYRDELSRSSGSGTSVLSNIYRPVDSASQGISLPSSIPKVSSTHLSGVALADTMVMLDERLRVTLGVRQQQVKSDNFGAGGAVTLSYDKAAVTPVAGVVIQPWQMVSLYANYIEGLSKGDIAPSTASNAGQVFAPYKTKQYETGVRIDHGRLMTTLSLFQITKPSGQVTNNVFAVDSEQRNRGMELNLYGEVAKGWRLLGGVTLLDAELTKTNNRATLGKRPVGVPTVQANLGGEWDTTWVKGLTLTGSIIYTGKEYVNQANTQSLPAWTRFDLGGRYSTKIEGKSATFRVNLLNVFDRHYWAGVASYGTISQGTSRTLQVSAAVDL